MSPKVAGSEEWVHFPGWIRGPARVENGEIVLDEGRAQRYALRDVDEVVFELAGLRDTDAVRTFVQRYGLLFHGQNSCGTGKCRESLDTWQQVVREVNITIGLYRALREAAKTGSASPVRSFLEGRRWGGLPLPENDEDYLKQNSSVLAAMISNHLSRCSTTLIPAFPLDKNTDPGKFVFSLRPRDLLAAAYVSFATLVAQRAELRECLGCGRLFHPESGKQKYHDAACASTSRWRRWKDRQAE